MTPEEVIKSLLEDEVLNTVLPVMSGVDAIAWRNRTISPSFTFMHNQHREPIHHSTSQLEISSPLSAATFSTPSLAPVVHIRYDNMGRLPALTFKRYMLHDDFVSFPRDFLTVANTHNALDHYWISQFCSYLQPDARDLFESRIDPHTLSSWSLA